MRWPAGALLVLTVGCAPGSAVTERDRVVPDPTPPPAAAVVDYQLGGAYEPADEVQIVSRDRTDDSIDGLYSICYVNAFQTQPDAGTWWVTHHDDLLLRDDAGELVEDEGWPGEYLFDISVEQKRYELAAIMGDWFAQCAADGFDAVEPDNLDSFTRSGGLLDQADAEAFAAILVADAHALDLAIGQKNTAEIDGAELGFDFAVAEECAVYDECGDYTTMYGGHVIEIEYTDNGRDAYASACAEAAGKRSILLRDRDVVPAGDPDYVYDHC